MLIIYTTIAILMATSIYFGYSYYRLKSERKILLEDLELQHQTNHSQKNTIIAISSLVDITWGKKSKYNPNKQEAMVIKQIVENLN